MYSLLVHIGERLLTKSVELPCCGVGRLSEGAFCAEREATVTTAAAMSIEFFTVGTSPHGSAPAKQ